ncbi:centrosome-associated protein 350 isoform X2 [Brachyhypopomus gauderio]|uniref:centrosome-associated protein 350 isoform X2 n=1 Tax=Brachyhypopomus gauderio TaxID=698409 RepID=UPI0040419AB3
MPAMNRPGFLTKAGLRRLLTSDEVWSFGRKKSHPSPPSCHVITERKTEDGKSLHQHEATQADCKPNCHEIKKIQSPVHNQQCPSKSSDVNSEQKTQNLSEAPWKSIKNVQRFPLGRQDQPCYGTSDRVHITSSLSSDIEEDLPYDDEDIHEKAGEQSNPTFQEAHKTYFASDDTILGCGQAIADYVTLNAQNNQRLQTVLSLNNNHEICDESRNTQMCDPDSVSHISGQQAWQSADEPTKDKPLFANWGKGLSCNVKRLEESPFCDDSFSETEDKSEPFSLQSEALVWSEEERDVLSEEKTHEAMCSLSYAENFIVAPETCSYDKHGLSLHFALRCKTETTADSALSEILSPVDEVLSYGSTELPPSGRGGGGSGPGSSGLLPPPPAFEIITWTSEEDLPLQPDLVEDISVNSENIPPLPTDPSLCRKKSYSLGESEINHDDSIIAHRCPALDAMMAIEQDEEEGSDQTSSLLVDESNDTLDPLFSFRIGDRVLVCKSRPGVLKYKGRASFAGGFWAGVALDTPTGSHGGTFRGVKYFTCEKGCGVLVRPEDISDLDREHCSDLGVDEDSYSDENPPNEYPPNEVSQKQNGDKIGDERPKKSQRFPGHVSLAPKQTCQQETYESTARIISNELWKCSRSVEKSPLKVDHKLVWYDGKHGFHVDLSDAKTAGISEDTQTVGLTEDTQTASLSEATVKNVQETKKRYRQRVESKHDSKSVDAEFGKREDSIFTTNTPYLMDQWCGVHPETPPQIQVNTHDHRIVYSIVDATVEVLCAHANEGTLDACETPRYLVGDKSHKGYRQVMFQLTSDILHEVCADILDSDSFQNTAVKSVMSALQRRHISVPLLKAAVKRETQKILNLEQTDQQMTEMLQKLCKYWYAKRDRVDYILIQELHNEESQWVDYRTDQITVKIQLCEEIFRLLLDDTISVLNHICISSIK